VSVGPGRSTTSVGMGSPHLFRTVRVLCVLTACSMAGPHPVMASNPISKIIFIMLPRANKLLLRLFLTAKRFNFFTMNVNCFPLKCSIAFWCSMGNVDSGEFDKMIYRQNDLLGFWITISGYSHVFFSGFLIFSISEFSHVVAWRVA